MAYDSTFIAFTSISLAATLMALVLSTKHIDRRELFGGLYAMLPSNKKAAKFSKLDEMTLAADKAMAARERGDRPGRMAEF